MTAERASWITQRKLAITEIVEAHIAASPTGPLAESAKTLLALMQTSRFADKSRQIEARLKPEIYMHKLFISMAGGIAAEDYEKYTEGLPLLTDDQLVHFIHQGLANAVGITLSLENGGQGRH